MNLLFINMLDDNMPLASHYQVRSFCWFHYTNCPCLYRWQITEKDPYFLVKSVCWKAPWIYVYRDFDCVWLFLIPYIVPNRWVILRAFEQGCSNERNQDRKSCLRDLQKSWICEGIPKFLFGDMISEERFSSYLLFEKKVLAEQGETKD